MAARRDKILVVDDEVNVRQLVATYLLQEGYEVSEAADGDAAVETARREHPDLIVLDLMLPGIDGFEVCRVLRGESDVFVLMLTARSEETDKLIGLGIGADDYLTKPFSPRELTARVKAILRRGRSTAPEKSLTAGRISIDHERHTARIGQHELDLTAREFEILEALVSHPQMVFTREKLLEIVWGYSYYGDPRVVDVHVAKLRKKMETDPGNPEYIKTVRGVGYKLDVKE